MPINDPILWYPMDTADISGTTIINRGSDGASNNGTLVGTPTTGQPGKIGDSILFPLNTGTINTAKDFNNPQSLTLACWFKASVTSRSLFRFVNGGINDRNLYIGNNNCLVFGVYVSGFQTILSASGVTNGIWRHAAATLNTGVISLYLDGVFQTSQASGTAYPFTGKWYIGEASPFGWPYGDGGMSPTYIDDARIYARALSAVEVADLYAYTGAANRLSPNMNGGFQDNAANGGMIGG